MQLELASFHSLLDSFARQLGWMNHGRDSFQFCNDLELLLKFCSQFSYLGLLLLDIFLLFFSIYNTLNLLRIVVLQTIKVIIKQIFDWLIDFLVIYHRAYLWCTSLLLTLLVLFSVLLVDRCRSWRQASLVKLAWLNLVTWPLVFLLECVLCLIWESTRSSGLRHPGVKRISKSIWLGFTRPLDTRSKAMGYRRKVLISFHRRFLYFRSHFAELLHSW